MADVYAPRGGRDLPPARAHAGALQRLWTGFTVERGARKPGYLAAAPARAAYVLYYTVTTAGSVVAALELARASGWQPRAQDADGPLRVLDLGAGSLGASMGVAAALGPRPLEVTALDGTAAVLADGAAIFEHFAPGVRVRTGRVDLRDALALSRAKVGRFDLVLCANVLNELPEARPGQASAAERLVERVLRDHLAPGGALLLLEPATRMGSLGVIALREALLAEGNARVVAPCTHEAACPLAEQRRDWCFFDVPWRAPNVVRACDDILGHGRSSLKASWLMLGAAADTTTDTTSAAGSGLPARVVGGEMRAGPLVRRYLCTSEGRLCARAEALSTPTWMRAPGRGFRIEVAGDARRETGRNGEVEVVVAAPRTPSAPEPRRRR